MQQKTSQDTNLFSVSKRGTARMRVLDNTTRTTQRAEDGDMKATLGLRLREFRDAMDITQTEIAARVGATKRGIQDNEAGKSAPNSKTIVGLVRAWPGCQLVFYGVGSMTRDQAHGEVSREELDIGLLAGVIAELQSLEEAIPPTGRLSAGRYARAVAHTTQRRGWGASIQPS